MNSNEKPARKVCGLALFLFFVSSFFISMAYSQNTDTAFHKMKVARVYEKKPEGYHEVIFLESARYYKLLCSNESYQSYLSLLKEAEKKKTTLFIKFTKINGDTILIVKKENPSAGQKINQPH